MGFPRETLPPPIVGPPSSFLARGEPDGGMSAKPSWEKVWAILDEAESNSLSPASRALVTANVKSASASRLSTAASAIRVMSAWSD